MCLKLRSLPKTSVIQLLSASGGGGKGIRIVKKAEDLEKAFKEAKSEGKNTLMMIVFMLRLLYLLQNMLKFKLWGWAG